MKPLVAVLSKGQPDMVVALLAAVLGVSKLIAPSFPVGGAMLVSRSQARPFVWHLSQGLVPEHFVFVARQFPHASRVLFLFSPASVKSKARLFSNVGLADRVA
jgi:hypothetical protein